MRRPRGFVIENLVFGGSRRALCITASAKQTRQHVVQPERVQLVSHSGASDAFPGRRPVNSTVMRQPLK
jgi:hypothetical protein